MRIVWWVFVIMVGCSIGSNQTHYYSLIQSKEPPSIKQANQAEIIVEPVTLARYLNNGSLVYQQSSTEVKFLNYHLWAQDVSQQITQFVINDLRTQLPKAWPTDVAMSTNRKASRVRIFFEAFNGSYSGNAMVKGEWQLVKNDRIIRSEIFSYVIPLREKGYGELIRALSQGLCLLSKDISEAM